jgi:DNA primase
MEYLSDRGYGPEVIEAFGLGWAEDEWESLLAAGEDAGFSESTLESAGLVIKRQTSGSYDRHRGQLIFPLYGQGGSPVGFAGRTINPSGDEPKYINSPETSAYSKDEYLYGLWSEQVIEAAGTAVITEGYTDVITLHRSGITNAVASSGTALTQSQASILSEMASQVVFAYDGDEAGLTSTIRGMKRCLQAGLWPRAVRLPEGEDPHSIVREEGGEAVWKAMRESKPLPPFLLSATERFGYELPEEQTPLSALLSVEVGGGQHLRQRYLIEVGRATGKPDRAIFRRSVTDKPEMT